MIWENENHTRHMPRLLCRVHLFALPAIAFIYVHFLFNIQECFLARDVRHI